MHIVCLFAALSNCAQLLAFHFSLVPLRQSSPLKWAICEEDRFVKHLGGRSMKHLAGSRYNLQFSVFL